MQHRSSLKFFLSEALLPVLALCAPGLFAQTSTSSPYSRFGLGDLNSPGFTFAQSMAGTGIALQNDSTAPFFINTLNPASYSSVRLTSFDFGITNTVASLQTTDENHTARNAALNNIAFGFPVSKKWGTVLGLKPYSNVGYHINSKQTNDSIGDIYYVYEGSGGVNRVFIGNAFNPFGTRMDKFHASAKYKQLKDEGSRARIHSIEKQIQALQSIALGLDVNYNFGNILFINRDSFPSNVNYLNTRVTKNTFISDLSFTGGLQFGFMIDSMNVKVDTAAKGPDTLHHRPAYKKVMKERKDRIRIGFGAVYGFETALNAYSTFLVESYRRKFQFDPARDTIEYDKNVRTSVMLPAFIGAGVTVKKGDKLLVSADYSTQDWSVFNSLGTGALKNSSRVSCGFQYVPHKLASRKEPFFQRLHYRAGFRYSDTYLELNSSRLTDMAVTLGFGFPGNPRKIGEIYSQPIINFAVELGQRGTTDNGLILERYVKLSVSLTLNDRWFIKRKYD